MSKVTIPKLWMVVFFGVRDLGFLYVFLCFFTHIYFFALSKKASPTLAIMSIFSTHGRRKGWRSTSCYSLRTFLLPVFHELQFNLRPVLAASFMVSGVCLSKVGVPLFRKKTTRNN